MYQGHEPIPVLHVMRLDSEVHGKGQSQCSYLPSNEHMIAVFDYRVQHPLKWVIDEVYTVYTYMQFRAAKSL